MAQHKQRPLSEVEIQILDTDLKACDKLIYSKSTEEMNNLAPPSLDELEAIMLPPSLEELHLEHAYSSINNSRRYYGRRKSYHGSTEKEDQKESSTKLDCEKGRRSRRGSSDRHRKRKNKDRESSDKKNDSMTESERIRRDRRKNYEKERRRMSYHGSSSKQEKYDKMLGNQKVEYIKSFEILQRSRSCGARPIREEVEEQQIRSSEETIREKFRDQLQKLSNAADVYDEAQIDKLGLISSLEQLLNRFNKKLSFDNKENPAGSDEEDSDQEEYCGRKSTLVSADDHLGLLPPRRSGTVENG